MEMASSDGASVEPVNCDVPPSIGRKGKKNLVADDDLQPTPKKTYNLRNRKPKVSEEEVTIRTPLSNRRTGKRLAESDSGFEVTSKKSYYSRKKTSTLSEEEVSKDSQEVKEIVNEEIEDMKGVVEMDTNDFKEFMGDMGFEEEKQNVGGGTEDSKENSKVTITTEETKEDLGTQKGMESTDGKISQNIEEILEMSAKACAMNDEGQMGTQKGMESTDGKISQNIEEILEMSAKACAMNDEGQMVSIKEEQSVAEEIKDVKESSEVVTNITVEETKEELGSQRGNVEEPLEISTKASAVNDEGQLVSEEEEQNVGDGTQEIIENLKVTITTEETKEELGMQKGTESTDRENLQNMEETLEMSAKACAVNDEGQLVSNKEEQSIIEEIDDVKENLEVATNIIVEDTKEELGIQRGNVEEPLEVGTKAPAVNDERQLVSKEEKHTVYEEIEDTIENSKVTISTEETKEELGIHKGTESTGGKKLQNTEETLEMSAEAYAVNEEGQPVFNKEEQSVAEKIEYVKESLEVVINIAVEETKEESVSHKVNKSLDEEAGNRNTILVKCARSFVEKSVAELGSTEVKEFINEETTNMEENSAEVNTEMAAEETKETNEETIDMEENSAEVNTEVAAEETKETNKYLGSQEETKGMDEETEDMNVPGDEVKGQLASHGGGAIDEEMNDVLELYEVSRGGCMTDSQEKTEDEVISAKETLEASKMAHVEEAKEDKSFAPIPKTPVATRSKIPKKPVATRSKILFMGNLPYSIDRKTVLSFFEDVGNVVDIRMAKNADGSMKGFCHVTFATAAAAAKALEKNGEIFHNRNVKLDLAENLSNKHVLGSTVLVRGLERSQPEEDIRKCLMKHFGDCGSVKNIHVPKDIQTGNSRVAFIRFDDSEAVSKAVKLCGLDLGDSKLFVKEVGRSRFRRKSSNAKRRNSKRQVPSKTNQ